MGNVGQLAVDLIISTLGMTKVGYFYTDCLVPMVGNNPYATTADNATELCINAEGKCYKHNLVEMHLSIDFGYDFMMSFIQRDLLLRASSRI